MTDAKIFPIPSYRTGKLYIITNGIDNHVLAIFISPKYLYNREKQRLKEKIYA